MARNREPMVKCKPCLGTGDRYVPTSDGKMMKKVDCLRCKGKGEVPAQTSGHSRVSRSW